MEHGWLCKLSCLLTSVGAVAWGVYALGYNVWDLAIFQGHMALVAKVLQGVVGLAGLHGLWWLVAGDK